MSENNNKELGDAKYVVDLSMIVMMMLSCSDYR